MMWAKCVELFRLRSIKGKMFMLFALCFLSIIVLTILNSWNLSALRSRLILSERYDDLVNDILEARRYEKNYLIYRDQQNLQDGLDYLEKIEELADELSGDLILLTGSEGYATFRRTLENYRGLALKSSKGDTDAPDLMRSVGKTLVNTADQFRLLKRRHIHATITRTSILPFAFLSIFLMLTIVVTVLVLRGLLHPLNIIAETTKRVGNGDFSPIQYEGGNIEEISGLIGAFNSMAHRLEINQEDLIQTRKIAAIGTFTAGIAHELNNPINNIMLTADTLNELYQDNLDDEGREMLGDMVSQADRAAGIVRNLLDFSRTENPVFTDLLPAKIIQSSVNLVKNQIRLEGINLDVEADESLPFVRGNLGNLQQVFTNLLINAVYATPKEGLMRISASIKEEWPECICFTVEDNGTGMPAEVVDKIFEPFFSTREVGKGTGLGMSVSYSIVQRHGGQIKVQSEEGQGTIVNVLLPVAGGAGCLE